MRSQALSKRLNNRVGERQIDDLRGAISGVNRQKYMLTEHLQVLRQMVQPKHSRIYGGLSPLHRAQFTEELLSRLAVDTARLLREINSIRRIAKEFIEEAHQMVDCD